MPVGVRRNLPSISGAIYRASILNRFEQVGVEGPVDGKAPEQKPRVTPEIEAFLQRKEEGRIWNSSLLGEAVTEQFGVRLGREAIRMKLLELGYSWKRARYAPGKQADPEVVAEHQASLETLVLDKTAPSGPVR